MTAMEPLSFVTDLHANSGVYRLAKAIVVERSAGVVAGFAIVALALLAGALGSPLARLIGRRAMQQKRGGAAARRLASSACALGLLFLAGLGATLAVTAREAPFVLVYGVPGWAAPLFLLPVLIALLVFAALLLTRSAWRSAGWSPWRRVFHSVAILGCVALLCLLLGFGVL
jgi:hypothetical protein